MAKRLSSLFSLSRNDAPPANLSTRRESDPSVASSSIPRPISNAKLHKHRTTSPVEDQPPPSSSVYPLEPPPLLTQAGLSRPSSRGTASRPGSGDGSQQSSREGSRSRPQSPAIYQPISAGTSPANAANLTSAKASKRRSWMPGRTEKQTPDDGHGEAHAWVAGLREHVPYDMNPLLHGAQVSELWSEQGDVIVHLFPESSERGPSFKVDSALFVESRALSYLGPSLSTSHNLHSTTEMTSNFPNLILHDSYGNNERPVSRQSSAQGSRLSAMFSGQNTHWPVSSEKSVHLPLEFEANLSSSASMPQRDDLELLVLYRNFFAFLCGGALVSTPRQPTLYSIFMGISTILKRYSFTSPDGSSYGDLATTSFAKYCDELRLADVRSSREKTIEAIVLGEHMRCWSLYNEGFVHAAGRLNDVRSIKSVKYAKVSGVTVNRLERAHLDVEQRLLTVRGKLEDFDFPSMFAGIANSQTSTEVKLVRFKAWKAAFLDFRRFILSHYRRKYGAWPPKAGSKKNKFEESGLNRLLLQELYQDFTDLYDMLVDRQQLTDRTTDMPALADDTEASDISETIQHAIRRVESEYDRSSPPVMPPIPFDTPLMPAFANSFNRIHVVIPKNSVTNTKRLKDNEVNEILLGSYNRESIKASPFIQDFIAYERRMGQGQTLDDLADSRCGQWLFMYAVLQALPMTVVDARDVIHTEGVEYFLCIPSRGGRPWMKEDTAISRAWYNVASGGAVVSLPADAIDHSVEGIYRRSHCWTAATKWAGGPDGHMAAPEARSNKMLPPPPPIGGASTFRTSTYSPYHSPHVSPMLRPVSPNDSEGRLSRPESRMSLNMGLEVMASPPPGSARPVSVLNPNLTFDHILGTTDQQKLASKKGKK